MSRSWNMGLKLAEGDAVFVMNADLRVKAAAIEQLERYLFSLERAVVVGPQGAHLDFAALRVLRYFERGTFSQPTPTSDVSGFFFALHLARFMAHRLAFDVRYSPCFFEEWDMGLQVASAGLLCYAVPVNEFEHIWDFWRRRTP